MSNTTTQYSDTSIDLVNQLTKYSKPLSKEFNEQGGQSLNPVLVIFTLLNSMNKKDKKIEDETVEQIKRDFETLPNFYHIQCLRLFMDRFNNEIAHNVGLQEQSLRSIEVVDGLMNLAKIFYEETKRYPSAFELIFLFIEANLKDSDKQQQIADFISDHEFQNRVIEDFCRKFQDQYGEKMKAGVAANEK